METAPQEQLMQDALALRVLIEQEQSEDADGVDLMMLTLLDIFIRDEQYKFGYIENPYPDASVRHLFLKQILRTADKILDKLREHAEALGFIDNLPPTARGLIQFLFSVALSVTMTIGAGADHE